MTDALAERLDDVQQRVAEAARDAGREPADITTIVVTKFQPIELVRALYDLGVRDFGESRHPEARDKAAALQDSRTADATWHFVGQLQTNKARQVARYTRVLHSVDRPELVDALGGHTLDVLAQIDLTGGAQGRGGVEPAGLEALATRISATDGLRLRGVMAVAPQDVEPGRAFAELAGCAERVRRIAPDATWISAGMSGDFRAAIAAGATHLRIGTAITGERPSIQ